MDSTTSRGTVEWALPCAHNATECFSVGFCHQLDEKLDENFPICRAQLSVHGRGPLVALKPDPFMILSQLSAPLSPTRAVCSPARAAWKSWHLRWSRPWTVPNARSMRLADLIRELRMSHTLVNVPIETATRRCCRLQVPERSDSAPRGQLRIPGTCLSLANDQSSVEPHTIGQHDMPALLYCRWH
ncbi:hypothetical protein M8818_004225 [Zalaria obscura]|uniref:Uncharacterized protein n=1 Tax=Zalaria obscura TaxID=2024903 RepID=A0ACC3SF56_9PEZI